jgi:hypothetical protein
MGSRYAYLIATVAAIGANVASGLNLLSVWRVMPETKGRSLEEIERSW